MDLFVLLQFLIDMKTMSARIVAGILTPVELECLCASMHGYFFDLAPSSSHDHVVIFSS